MLNRETIENVIGKGFADVLDEVVFSIGNEHYTRRHMIEDIGCANFIAAARLSKVLKKLKITTPKQLWDMDPISLARVTGVGAASLYVAMCILDNAKYDVVKWWGWNDNVVKFSTFKAHAMTRASRRGKQDVA